MQKKNDHTLLPIYDTLENINKTPSEHSNIHHVHLIHTKLPSLQKVNKVEKKMRYQTGTHELEKRLPVSVDFTGLTSSPSRGCFKMTKEC